VQLISFYISVPYFVGLYLGMYQLIVILLLIRTFFKNKIKSASYNLLYVFNTMAAWCSLLLFLAYASEFFMAWYGQDPYEWYAFKGNEDSEFWTWVFVSNILSILLGLLFFFRKLRINRWFTLLFFLSGFGFFYERMIIRITSKYRDYLPSSWSTYYDINSWDLYAYGVIILLLVLIYVWAKKKGRLPFPSVFLK